jgi:DNA-binding NarL/FixJ family response regulator
MADIINNKNSQKMNSGLPEKNPLQKNLLRDDYTTSTVLIISDNDFTILSLKYLLESKNLFVLTAANSGVAAHLLENIKTDLVLIDYNISESYCLEVLKSISVAFSSTIVIIYSSNKDGVNENQFLEAGASCLLNMSDNENLLKSIQSLL